LVPRITPMTLRPSRISQREAARIVTVGGWVLSFSFSASSAVT